MWKLVALLLALSTPALAKKPKGPPPPPPEVVEAFTTYGEAATVYADAYQAADTYALQQLIWGLGDFGVQLNVFVIHPDPTAEGTGAAKPADVAERAAEDAVFHYHVATDTFIEIRPGEGATPADARALLDAVVVGV